MNYLKLGAYGLAALLLFGAGWMVEGWRADAKYAALQASDAAARADGEAAVRKDLQAQLASVKATSANNSAVIGKLQDENTQLAADRDANLALAQRLLAGQARFTPASGAVPQAPNHPAAAAAGGATGNESIAGLLVDAADECQRNADRLDALSAQIGLQL